MIFRSLIVGVDKLASKAEIIESLNSPILLKALNTLSKCSVAMLKVTYQGGNVTHKGGFMTTQRMFGSLVAWGPQIEGSNSQTFLIYLMEVA